MGTEFPESARPKSERVIVVSLMKSGTHLIQELMIALGYGIYGQSRIPAEARPRLSVETRRHTAELDVVEVISGDTHGEPCSHHRTVHRDRDR
jgi:hypothetical protein